MPYGVFGSLLHFTQIMFATQYSITYTYNLTGEKEQDFLALLGTNFPNCFQLSSSVEFRCDSEHATIGVGQALLDPGRAFLAPHACMSKYQERRSGR